MRHGSHAFVITDTSRFHAGGFVFGIVYERRIAVRNLTPKLISMPTFPSLTARRTCSTIRLLAITIADDFLSACGTDSRHIGLR